MHPLHLLDTVVAAQIQLLPAITAMHVLVLPRFLLPMLLIVVVARGLQCKVDSVLLVHVRRRAAITGGRVLPVLLAKPVI